MKILHIGYNICGIHGRIRDAQIELGHTSKILSFETDLNNPSDFEYNIPYSIGRLRSSFMRSLLLLKVGWSYDVFHFVGNSLANGLDIILWKLLGKIVIIHNHGSEIRGKKQPYFHRFADLIFVSTPDLLKFAHRSTWIPNPVYIDNNYTSCKSDKLIITHAPSDPLKKGTSDIILFMKELEDEFPELKFNYISGVSYKDALDNYCKSTIVIDQLKIGWYGMVSLECMAIGVPVVCYISKDMLKYLPDEYPLWVTTKETFKSDILYLLNNKDVYDKQIELGKIYVSTVHNPMNITKIIMRKINELLG
jgi:glycosyltransferase involved in cell wall biosynthesis